MTREQGPPTRRVLGGSGSRELASVSVGEQDGVVVVTIGGEVDISNIDRVSHAIFDQPNTGDGLVVDLAQVRYLDSTAVSMLHDLAARLRHRAQQLIVVSPTGSPPRRVLDLTALYVNAPISEDLGSAVSLLRGSAPP